MRGGTARGWFLNAVALFETTLSPDDVLARCRALEADAGRRRARFWGDRPLDLDVLLFEGVVTPGPRLALPHPGIPSRAFVLAQLVEVWPDATDPTSGRRYGSLPSAPGPRPAPAGILAWTRRRR